MPQLHEISFEIIFSQTDDQIKFYKNKGPIFQLTDPEIFAVGLMKI